MKPTYSLILPVYKNRESIPPLITTIASLNQALENELEAVFVVDGSPDDSYNVLSQALPLASFRSKLILLSRNFGAFSAIHRGLISGSGDYFAVMAADLQEPPELVISFFKKLSDDECDIVVGKRLSRGDPFMSRLGSSVFWSICRGFIQKELPEGGVDAFGCNRLVRDQLVQMQESHSSLILQLYWLGFRRLHIDYERKKRMYGKSAWSLRRKVQYFSDSIFGFTDLPIRLLITSGAFGLLISIVMASVVLTAYLLGFVPVLGYTPIMLAMSFFAALQLFSLGIVASYLWRTFENSKMRPLTIVSREHDFGGTASSG